MTHTSRGQLDWSVRYGARSTYTERVAADTLEGAADLLARHLPANAGYEVRRVWLSGSLCGASFRVRRGSFVASVSVQRFQSPGRSTEEADAYKLRVVARSSPRSVALAKQTQPSNGLRVAGGAAALFAAGALTLSIAGSLTAWATAILLLPAMFATRLFMTLWVADTIHRRALPAGELPESTQSATEVRDQERWQAVLDGLQNLHENVAERLMLRPFRGMGSPSTPLALGPAPPLQSAS
ncbi:MAG: hypothetical protein ACRBN8_25895 [Nannocystales bacterium]